MVNEQVKNKNESIFFFFLILSKLCMRDFKMNLTFRVADDEKNAINGC